MAEYVVVPYEADPGTIEGQIYDYIQSVFPGFAPRASHLITIQTEALAEAISELMQMATDVPPEIFLYLGQLFAVEHISAAVASVSVTITAIDSDGDHLVPEGYAFRLHIGGDDWAAFQLTSDALIPAGETEITGVGAVAIEEGTKSNGLGGSIGSGSLEWIDILEWVDDTSTEAPSEGGVDAETTDAYMDKLATRLQLLKDGIVLARDAEVYIQGVAGVSRAKAIDNYDPDTDDDAAEKTVAWTALDTDGNVVVDPLKATIQALLEATRELNFNFPFMNPTNNAVTIDVTVKSDLSAELSEIESSVEVELATYMNPLVFNSVLANNAEQTWVNRDKLYYLEVATIVNNSAGVDRIVTLTINGVAGDLALAGKIPLITQPPTINVTAEV